MRGTMVKFDPVRLQNAIGRRGLTPAEMSREMGACNSFMRTVLNRGTMRLETLNLLKERYNITFQDIQFKTAEDPEEQKAPTPDVTVKVIEEAVYHALSRLNIEEVLYSAMRRALSE